MLELTAEYWSGRYSDETTGWDIGHASAPLVHYFKKLTDKQLKILIPGCGNAYEAEYLHQEGFTNVWIADWSKEPLDNFKKRVPTFPSSHLIHGDFFAIKDAFDLVVEQTFFCAISPELRTKYAEKVNSLLTDQGKLIGVLFEDKLNTDQPPYGGSKEEYIQVFSPYLNINTMELTPHSEKPRLGRELFIELSKKK